MDLTDQWYREGLSFHCTGCGKCCLGSDAYVFLSKNDIAKLARHLQIDEEEFLQRYTRIVDGQICLLDAENSDACVFLKEKKCSVYENRPVQCRTFPFWPHNLQNQESWRQAKESCEGIDHPDSKKISENKIACECMIYLDNLE